jgi:AraC family transcriptional regulator
MMTALVMYLVQHYTSRSLPLVDPGDLDRPRLQRLVDYIDLHLHQPMDLAAMAQELAMGELTLCWAFINRMGRPLYQYVAEKRLQRAQLLLRVGGLPPDQVAPYCGYPSVEVMQTQLGKKL